jgi:hypothetical protein
MMNLVSNPLDFESMVNLFPYAGAADRQGLIDLVRAGERLIKWSRGGRVWTLF